MQPVDTNGHGDPEFAALSEHPHSMQQESLTATIKRYQPTLYRAAFRMLRNAQDAEDAVQDALLPAFRNLSQFKGEAKMTTSLTAIVVNSARAINRRHYSRRQTVSLHQMEDERSTSKEDMFIDGRPGPEEVHGRAELRCKLRKSSKRLSPGVRDAFHRWSCRAYPFRKRR